MEELISDDWRLAVCAILRRRNQNECIVRWRAQNNWQETFPDSFFRHTLFDAFIETLEKEGILGKRIDDMDEAGRTYAFWFYHQTIKIYGKINLLPSNKVVIVYSAHKPDRGEDRL